MEAKVHLIGRIGQEPEMRYTPGGTPVTNFSIATTTKQSKEKDCPKGWKESYNGKHWELTTWWRVTAWGRLAETVNQYAGKGQLVKVEGEVGGEAVDGTLRPRIWQNRAGQPNANFEVTARNVLFLTYGDSNGESGKPEEFDDTW